MPIKWIHRLVSYSPSNTQCEYQFENHHTHTQSKTAHNSTTQSAILASLRITVIMLTARALRNKNKTMGKIPLKWHFSKIAENVRPTHTHTATIQFIQYHKLTTTSFIYIKLNLKSQRDLCINTYWRTINVYKPNWFESSMNRQIIIIRPNLCNHILEHFFALSLLNWNIVRLKDLY